MIGMLVGAVGGVIAILGNGQIIPVAIGVALKCLGSAPACYVILALLADVIDHIEFKSGIRTDGLTMSIYSSIMVAATPVCNSIFSALLNMTGYDQSASVALGTAGQTALAKSAISVSYIWVETVCYVICATLIFFFTIEKDLPKEQQEIAARKKKEAKSRFQRFPLLPMRLQDAMLIFAHKMALPSHIHAGRFSCKHEICPQEYASEL